MHYTYYLSLALHLVIYLCGMLLYVKNREKNAQGFVIGMAAFALFLFSNITTSVLQYLFFESIRSGQDILHLSKYAPLRLIASAASYIAWVLLLISIHYLFKTNKRIAHDVQFQSNT
jgi:hypothetical protein